MSPIRMERYEAALRLVLEFVEATNRQDVAGMTGMVSEDCVFDEASPAPAGRRYAGKAALTRLWQDSFRGAPAARLTVEEIFGFGYRCVVRWTCVRVDTAGVETHLRGVDLYQVKEGLIYERLSYIKG